MAGVKMKEFVKKTSSPITISCLLLNMLKCLNVLVLLASAIVSLWFDLFPEYKGNTENGRVPYGTLPCHWQRWQQHQKGDAGDRLSYSFP